MDANHFISEPKLKGNFKLVPYYREEVTTHKKRTFIQAQLNKADQTVKEVKDHILTNLEITSYERCMINNEK